MDLIHRDDMDYPVVEKLVETLKELHPGMDVVFAGDTPPDQLPPELVEYMKQIEAAHNKSLYGGLCIDCGLKMDGWDQAALDGEDSLNTLVNVHVKQHKWRFFTNGKDGEPTAWQCPACDAKDEDGVESEFRPFEGHGGSEVRPEDGAPGGEVHGGDGG